MSALRIVHLGKYYPPASGGIENHTQTLAEAQAQLGADVRVVVVNHAAADGTDVTFERFRRTEDADSHEGQVRVIRVGRRANIAKLDVAPSLPRAIKDILRDPPDIWHLHAPNITMMLAVLAERRTRPLVITHHSDIIRQRLLKHVIRPIENAVYRRACRILPTSFSYVNGSELLQRYLDKVTPIPLGIDLTPFQNPSQIAIAHAEQLRKEHGSPLWLSVGRLIYYKGLHIGLEALKTVAGRLLIIGSGPMEAELRARAEQLGVADRVIWCGRASLDELVGAYHAATALWFPSTARSEGFGLVQVEAMASGCPVINTAIPGSGVSWVSRHEIEGLTVPVNDPYAFGRTAERLAQDQTLRNQLVIAGRTRVVNEFDWRVMGERSLELCVQAMAAH